MDKQIELPTISSHEELNKIIKNELKTDNFSIKITQGSAIGDNYFGVIYRIEAVVNNCENNDDGRQEENNNNNKSINIILKSPPQNQMRREEFFIRPCFLRESFIYEKILPLFAGFQIDKGLSQNECFYEIPKCYKTITMEMDEAIFLEDLKIKQFFMYDRKKLIDIEHSRLIMNVLGKLHAISFGLKTENNKEFIDASSTMTDIFKDRENVESFRNYLDHLVERAKSTLNPADDQNLMVKMNNIFNKNSLDILLEWVAGEQAEPYTVICHGDCWTNNILFKYNENNQPIDCRLLDWQISRYASPASDLTYFYFTCTDQEFRNKYYNELLEIYHKSLSNHLIRMGFDPESLFPFSALTEQLQQFGKFGLIMAILVLPVFTTLPEDVPDLDEVAERVQITGSFQTFNPKKSEDIYKKRMRDVIFDMDKLGYI